MSPAHLADPVAETEKAGHADSLDASDDFEPQAPEARYCPTELLGRFTLLMAGHGRCVSTAMMLGDREYAMWQLARARTFADEALHRAARQLFAYLDQPVGGRSGLGRRL